MRYQHIRDVGKVEFEWCKDDVKCKLMNMRA